MLRQKRLDFRKILCCRFSIACQLLRNQTSELKIGCYFNVTYDIAIFTRSIESVSYLGFQPNVIWPIYTVSSLLVADVGDGMFW